MEPTTSEAKEPDSAGPAEQEAESQPLASEEPTIQQDELPLAADPVDAPNLPSPESESREVEASEVVAPAEASTPTDIIADSAPQESETSTDNTATEIAPTGEVPESHDELAQPSDPLGDEKSEIVVSLTVLPYERDLIDDFSGGRGCPRKCSRAG